eukprot:TRINITY_DN13062_c0_g1_i1.p1 TRINITY_DN13062_c0_g1~~TRINITY_DN13062_c0_g1_i1.p1  ORF type:complete len:218 (+),score=39.67 TRINITY_DN13062_c0_g1_i1:32-655(+)
MILHTVRTTPRRKHVRDGSTFFKVCLSVIATAAVIIVVLKLMILQRQENLTELTELLDNERRTNQKLQTEFRDLEKQWSDCGAERTQLSVRVDKLKEANEKKKSVADLRIRTLEEQLQQEEELRLSLRGAYSLSRAKEKQLEEIAKQAREEADLHKRHDLEQLFKGDAHDKSVIEELQNAYEAQLLKQKEEIDRLKAELSSKKRSIV